MLKNYFKTALRNMLRQKVYSLINIVGLAFGMACCFLIMMWVLDELSFDRFHENADDIYNVVLNQHYSDGRSVITRCTPPVLSESLLNEYPEIINSCRYTPFSGYYTVTYQDNIFTENVNMTDNSFFEMFTFPFVKGNPEKALTDPGSAVITEKFAKKYFGDEEPLGKTLTISNKYDFTVSGILKDIPGNSSEQFEILLPFEFQRELGKNLDTWGYNSFYTWIQLSPGHDYHTVEAKIRDQIINNSSSTSKLTLQPMTKSRHYYSSGKPGDIIYIYLLSAIASIILIIACINFINLTTARSEKRAREIGLRKVVGADKKQLFGQFMSESVIMTLLALILALILTELLNPLLNNLVRREISWQMNSLHIIGIIGVTLFTGLVAGIYPAYVLSSLRPLKILKGSGGFSGKKLTLRKVLVTFQFFISITLIICCLVVLNQVKYMQNKDLGLDKDSVVRIPFKGLEEGKYAAFKNLLLENPDISSVTAALHWPTMIGSNGGGWNWEGKDPNQDVLMGFTYVDYDYFETLGIEMAAGRSYSSEFPADSSQSIIVNEAAVKLMNMDAPVGKILSVSDFNLTIIGVAKDFHFKPLDWEIEPLTILFGPSSNKHVFIRVSPKNMQGTLSVIEDTYKRVTPLNPFEYSFLDDRYERSYRAERRLAKLFTSFSAVAILISCLGIFGMVSYAAEKKTKEIGIRKVLGASEYSIVSLLSKEFLAFVVIANFIAWPIAYWLMSKWLREYAYRIEFTDWMLVFPGAGIAALLIALITVSFQSIRAANANPVNSIRYE